jgi:hypothetical protein
VNIASSNYWKRLWVIQEILLSMERNFLVLGNAYIPLREFYKQFRSYTDRQSLGYGTSFQGFGRFTRGFTMGLRSMDTEELIQLAAQSGCKDPRDRIFGLVGICPTLYDFEIDYRMNKIYLAAKVIQHMRPQGLERLVSMTRTVCEALNIQIGDGA